MREPPPIPEDSLRDCLRDQYGLGLPTIEFLPVGLDSRAGVYRVTPTAREPLLVKVKSGQLYEPGCLVPAWLREQGISEVVAPLPSTSHALWASVAEWTVIAYPYIEGDTSWRGMTDAQWVSVGETFRRIHTLSLPASDFPSLRRETFGTSEYARAIRDFEAHHAAAPHPASATERELHTAWLIHQPTIHTIIARMEQLAPMLQQGRLPYIICHADLHPANILRSPDGAVHVIDWDEVMLAPKERDFLFVGDPPDDGGEPAPFFQGYGDVEVDWAALTYYRYERVLQDLLASVDEVCFRDDLSDESKADSVELFNDVLSEGGIASALAAAAHLPFALVTQADTAS